ncbi:putative nucleotidyltransferase, Ribonuclease H [Helianthus annuus]|nr:putative nucleotidyltransferase, Ribonuclease H [Helianthus annuus]
MFKYSYCFCIWDIQKIAPVGSLLQSSILGVLPTYRLQQFGAFILLTMPPRKDQTQTDDPIQNLCEQFSQFFTHYTTTSAQSESRSSAQFEALQASIQQQTETTNRLLANLTIDPKQAKLILKPTAPQDDPLETSNPRPPKINLPMFDGSNPLDWIFQAENYFTYYNIPENRRLSLSVFYFTGEALSWYKYLHNNSLLGTWQEFSRALELRFALLNCYLSGLRNDIQAELAIIKPTTLNQAYGLSKRIEDKLNISKPKTFQPRTYTPTQFTTPSSSLTSPSSSSTIVTTTPKPGQPPLLANPHTPKTQLPFTKLSPEALQKRRSEGLCFRCPERYFPGHKCNPPQFLLIADNDPDEPPDPPENTVLSLSSDPTDSIDTHQFFSLSSAAFFGLSSPQALRVTGYINNQPVQVLIDSGSTHNIVQPRIVSFLKLPHQNVTEFSVMVGNGENLKCNGVCPSVMITLQEASFTIPVFILPVEGADIILGLAWLRTLGPVLADFSIPQLTFNVGPKAITLRGEHTSAQVSSSSLHTLISKNSVASLHALYFHVTTPSQTSPPINLTHNDPTIQQLLQTYDHIFQIPTQLPPNRSQDHHIPTLPMSKPINVRPYRYPQYQKQIMSKLIEEMLRDGVIKPSQSPFSSPVLLVRKKDGSWRFCVDYRALNAITIKDRFPIPTVDELLDELHGAVVFSKIDLTAGYHQIRLATEDTHKTAFRTVDGHYEFLVMPFGLSNAPSTFQATMNDLFRDVLRRYVLVFFDDILIYSRSTEEHYYHLQQVFETLSQNLFFAKPSKCTFAVSSVAYLGHIISAKGVEADPEKLSAIQSWPVPTSLSTLRGFLGLTGYYRRFVRNYAQIAAPLTDILKLPSFKWSNHSEAAFKALKSAMISLVTLTLPNFSKPFDVTTDASNVAIGAVLSQEDRPIAFFSKKMCPRMQVASAYVRELYAVTEAVKKWRQYLLGRKFNIFTDQRSLKHLLSQVVQTPEQYKWATKLIGYDFEIHYKPGKENRVADALSRINTPQVMAISFTNPKWVHDLKNFYASPDGRVLIHKCMAKSTGSQFMMKDGVLYYQSKIFIPCQQQLRLLLLNEFHASQAGGHSGIRVTIKRLAAAFSWPKLKADVVNFIRQCQVCQQVKYPTHKPYGLLQPLPIPSNVWQDVSMDFITNLPLSNGKSAIWVIVDRFSKFAHFIPLPPHYGAVMLATLFLQNVYRLHGFPKSIVTDRDPIFLSKFWKELFKQVGTKLKFSTAYHPQTDGQTEVVNRCLQNFLRSFAGDEPRAWSKYLYLAEYWYNTSHHSSINMSPFQALYGQPIPEAIRYKPEMSDNPSIDFTLKEMQRLRVVLKQNLKRAQQRMSSLANEHRMDKEFQIGDMVFLKLQDYRQKSVENRSYRKLSKRFYGPFKVIERIGAVAYKLQLPPGATVHPVFHVSLLREAKGNPVPSPLPAFTGSDELLLQPSKVLSSRHKLGKLEILVAWEDRDIAEATWEEYDEFTVRFPDFQVELEDELVLKGKAYDTGQGVAGPKARPKRIIKKPAKFLD